ncbi:hypothetical protein DFH09DRAFT_1083632 [Mycena vulgaris]|nr:hypothetical protein DFH09DRAFT_1083632 [Mycena vulgaris]
MSDQKILLDTLKAAYLSLMAKAEYAVVGCTIPLIESISPMGLGAHLFIPSHFPVFRRELRDFRRDTLASRSNTGKLLLGEKEARTSVTLQLRAVVSKLYIVIATWQFFRSFTLLHCTAWFGTGKMLTNNRRNRTSGRGASSFLSCPILTLQLIPSTPSFPQCRPSLKNPPPRNGLRRKKKEERVVPTLITSPLISAQPSNQATDAPPQPAEERDAAHKETAAYSSATEIAPMQPRPCVGIGAGANIPYTEEHAREAERIAEKRGRAVSSDMVCPVSSVNPGAWPTLTSEVIRAAAN